MYCPECQTKNAADAKFCENCGKPLLKVITAKPATGRCPACGEEHTAADQFCQSCGAALPKTADKQPRTSLARALPREERYRQARQLALKLSEGAGQLSARAPTIYIGERIS